MRTPVITRKVRHRIVAGLVASLVGIVGAVNVLAGTPITTEARALPAESFELFDGAETTLAGFDGKPLVVNFWASWCPACVAELPEIQAVYEKYNGEVVILGLANQDRRDAAQQLADEVGVTYTLADDPNGDLFRALDLIAMPSTVFITGDGEILEVFGGQLNESALSERIERLVAAS